MKRKVCKDCKAEGVETLRDAKYPGPRCATHHRLRKKQLKEANHERHIKATYGITKAQYDQLYKAQGGVCFICRRAKGKVKKLSVDHDHKTGLVRGLLCGTCNKFIIGRIRDDHEALLRAAEYLQNPPAIDIIGEVKVP